MCVETKIMQFDTSNDITKTNKFFKDLFTWNNSDKPENDSWFMLPSIPQGPKDLNFLIGVSNLKKYIQKVKQIGGAIMEEDMEVKGWGHMAICIDDKNRAFGLWQDDNPF